MAITPPVYPSGGYKAPHETRGTPASESLSQYMKIARQFGVGKLGELLKQTANPIYNDKWLRIWITDNFGAEGLTQLDTAYQGAQDLTSFQGSRSKRHLAHCDRNTPLVPGREQGASRTG